MPVLMQIMRAIHRSVPVPLALHEARLLHSSYDYMYLSGLSIQI